VGATAAASGTAGEREAAAAKGTPAAAKGTPAGRCGRAAAQRQEAFFELRFGLSATKKKKMDSQNFQEVLEKVYQDLDSLQERFEREQQLNQHRFAIMAWSNVLFALLVAMALFVTPKRRR
jgi:hypothetical protein